MSQYDEDRLFSLLTDVRENHSSPSRAELNRILRENPSARSMMARMLVDEHALISRLRDDNLASMFTSKPRQTTLPAKARKHIAWERLAIAALIAVSGFLTWLVIHPARSTPQGPTLQPLAILKDEADAVWRGGHPAAGSPLAAGPLCLVSGMAAIEFASGARVLLEGPAELELISSMHALCKRGRLLAHVPPPAEGFMIETPSARLVDRGTSFGLDVKPDGGSHVKVMQGLVDLHVGDQVAPLGETKAASIDFRGVIREISLPDDAFPTEETFRGDVLELARQNREKWQAASKSLEADRDLLLSYNFLETPDSGRTVANLVASAPAESHASLVGTRWTQGRWIGKRALEFKSPGDRMLFNLSGIHPAATYLAWIRVDSLPNAYHILMMPDTSRPRALQWMIDGAGNLRLALTNDLAKPGSPRGWDGPVKAEALTNLDFGRWIFIASTYDSATGEVIHYRDGRVIGTGVFPKKLPVDFNSFSFGNWPSGKGSVRPTSQNDTYRNFIGCLDELSVFSRALSAGEIDRIYRSGRP